VHLSAVHHSHRSRWRTSFVGAAIVVVALTAVSGTALAGEHAGVTVTRTNLVANRDGFGAAKVDPNLVNAWGMSKFPTSPVWVSDNGADKTTLYTRGTAADPAATTIVPLVVGVPGGPTGQIANATNEFNLANNAAARFIFVNEAGELYGWNQASGTAAELKGAVDGAVFKGLAQVNRDGKSYLLAANFTGERIEVFDGTWAHVDWGNAFTVRHLPQGFSPFNVQTLTDPAGQAHVFVAYAKHEPGAKDETAGRNLGLVVEYTTSGKFVRRFERDGSNAPWGLAYAPKTWGSHAGELLVGQFGNGRIETYDPESGEHTGSLRGADGHKLVIDGLWALMAGDATAGGTDTILFTAGPNGEVDGVFGVLSAQVSNGEDND